MQRRRYYRKSVFASLILLPFLASATATAQETSPEEVAAAYLAARDSVALERVVRYMHPSTLDSLRALVLLVVEEDEPERRREQFGVSSMDVLRELEPDSLLVRFFSEVLPPGEMLPEGLSGSSSEVLGHVAEGPDTVHVVRRLRSRAMPGILQAVDQLDVVTLRRHEQTWKVVSDPTLSLLQMLLGARAAAPRWMMEPPGSEQDALSATSPPAYVDYENDCRLTLEEGEATYYVDGAKQQGAPVPDSLDPEKLTGIQVYKCQELIGDSTATNGIIVITTKDE